MKQHTIHLRVTDNSVLEKASKWIVGSEKCLISWFNELIQNQDPFHSNPAIALNNVTNQIG